MSLSTVVKVAIALLIAFFAIEKLRVHRADQRLRSPVGTTQQQPFADGPVQTATRDAPFVRQGYEIKPLANFAVRARVLSREDYVLGREADLSRTDLALGWQRMADPTVYGLLNISQGSRWYRYSWRDQPPIPLQEIIESSANMHMIAADATVERALAKNLFKVFSGSHKYLAGMGCKARCAVDSLAIHKRRNAADRAARHLPEGLE